MDSSKVQTSLEQLLQGKDLFDYFYNDTLAPHSRARPGLTPVPMEHTTWIEEPRAWRETAVLFDQSHHMPELYVEGPDAFRFLNSIGINSFENFVPGRCRQFVGCNPHGQVIGESLLYYLAENKFELVSGMPLLNWVSYNAAISDLDITLTWDPATSNNKTGKRFKFRFGMDGPNAAKIFEAAVEGPVPEIKFFRTAKVRIGGCDVLALRHGMAGHMGVELSGAYDDGPAVRAALLEAGQAFGLKPGGTLAYFSANAESGWIAAPFPAIYTAPEMKAYREWLPSTVWEASAQLGGSFISRNLEDYYLTPWDMGIEKHIKFDHDFIGREALAALAQTPRRVRRTLVWDKADVARINASLLEEGDPFKMLRLPVATYAYQQNDAVLNAKGEIIGTAAFCGYTANERVFLSLARISADYGEIGTELELVWGEPDGGSRKPHVERHRQTRVKVTVAPAPFAATVREIKKKKIDA
ncbi:MAG: aminomethyl transferase family protein [Novosphingobium sp.]|nr:aminomethyl transferase family protein [Novosphingobium sp.]